MGKSNSAKSAAVVFGALACGWLAIELAFKPLLLKARSAIEKSDPARDPDDVIDESAKSSPDNAHASSSDSPTHATV